MALQAILDSFNAAKTDPENFEYYLADQGGYKHLLFISNDYDHMSFASFIKWNLDHIAKLSDEDRVFLKALCRNIRADKFTVTDRDKGWSAFALHYDMRGRLCITQRR
jgi:hypothetical protein